MTQDGARDQVILRDLGDGLILRRATPEDTKALVAFNTELHRDWDTQEPDQSLIARVGGGMKEEECTS